MAEAKRIDFSTLVQTLDDDGERLVLVRPGLSLALHWDVPLGDLARHVVDIMGDFLAFIAPGRLDRYYAPNGVYKPLTPKVLDTTLAALRRAEPGDETFEFHFGPGLDVGSGFAAHFMAASLEGETSLPGELNLLMLEFPPGFVDQVGPAAFFEFVVRSADRVAVDSGLAGYAFQHPVLALREEAVEAIAKVAMRYRGFDISFDDFHYEGKGTVYNTSWINLLGRPLVDKLGGQDRLAAALPASARLVPLRHGVAVVACERPAVGDVNRQAPDLPPYRDLARVLKPVRAELDNLGPDDELFAEQWLTRLDG